ncbi:putative serine carboxypeptidase CPVL-like protein [Leptotrombidium deliense]|uniref:Putative serine carboxypeptidase CPVL-like protein n=1 Tax=Leptotrombidium deliense TaxID=299467 RepID=A0A443SES2_9ACAR|nr:putative serine carboxypeptidase CPVL-like protein [Leptotrombidium deliense]
MFHCVVSLFLCALQICAAQDDYGEPLFLTPLIESGELEEAKQLSQVVDPQFECGGESYSAYLTVNSTVNSNLFFWFFKSQEANAPVVLWLDGGPGTSSLFGLFVLNGPFTVINETNIECREFSWTKAFSVLYIDQPLGTGFSFTDDEDAFSKDISESTDNLYNALTQFFTLFEEIQFNEFYAIGYSYGGKYIPAIAQKIRNEENPIFNLKGIACGNAFFDPYSQLSYGPLLYQFSLIDENLKLGFDEKEKEIQQLIDDEMFEDAFAAFDRLINKGIFTDATFYNNATGYNYYYDVRFTNDPINTTSMVAFLDTPSVHNALHVGNHPFILGGDTNVPVITALISDFMRSVKEIVVDVLNSDFRVLIYSGNMDIIEAPVFTSQFLNNLEGWNNREQYINSTHEIWRLEDEANDVAGYIKRANNFAFVIVRNTGHMAPYFQPKVMYSMITQFVQNSL